VVVRTGVGEVRVGSCWGTRHPVKKMLVTIGKEHVAVVKTSLHLSAP
jgi:hypothetical protein